MARVRMTLEGEARQVHPTGGGSHCNCHELIAWLGDGYLVGSGIDIDGELAGPMDWIVRINDETRIVRAQDFAKYYQFVGD